MSIKQNLKELKSKLPKEVALVAVSKTKPNSDLEEAYEEGQRVFGENKVQELVQKYEDLPKDIQWHFIGHLQKNKVKYIAPFVDLIHSADSISLLKEIDKRAKQNYKSIKVLLQIYIAKEESKFGFEKEELFNFIESKELQFENVTIVGVMGMATNTDDKEVVAREFGELKSIFEELKSGSFSNNPEFKEISMGMSGDYEIAIKQGSTMIRVGSTIFGHRNY